MIREAGPKDIDEIYALWCKLMNFHQNHHPIFSYNQNEDQLLKQKLISRLHDQHTKFFVYESNSELLGMIIASFKNTSKAFNFSKKGYIAETVGKE